VLVGHFAFAAGFPIHRAWWTDAYAHYGVLIFFVISGYLITTLLVRERAKTGTINLKQFTSAVPIASSPQPIFT